MDVVDDSTEDSVIGDTLLEGCIPVLLLVLTAVIRTVTACGVQLVIVCRLVYKLAGKEWSMSQFFIFMVVVVWCLISKFVFVIVILVMWSLVVVLSISQRKISIVNVFCISVLLCTKNLHNLCHWHYCIRLLLVWLHVHVPHFYDVLYFIFSMTEFRLNTWWGGTTLIRSLRWGNRMYIIRVFIFSRTIPSVTLGSDLVFLQFDI